MTFEDLLLLVITDEIARRDNAASEIASGEHEVRRCVPMLPFSSELEQLRRLKRSLAIYRVVFGQPCQQEMLALLERSDLAQEELEAWTISLLPD